MQCPAQVLDPQQDSNKLLEPCRAISHQAGVPHTGGLLPTISVT